MVESRKGLRQKSAETELPDPAGSFSHYFPQAWLSESSSILMLCGITDAGSAFSTPCLLSPHFPSAHSFPGPAVEKCPWCWELGDSPVVGSERVAGSPIGVG